MNDNTSRDWRRLAQKMEYPISGQQAKTLKNTIAVRHRSQARRQKKMGVALGAFVLCFAGFMVKSFFLDEAASSESAAISIQSVARTSVPKPLREKNSLSVQKQSSEKASAPHVVATTPGTRFSVEEEVASSTVHLDRGSVRIETNPDSPQELTVHVGALVIRDIGTVFTVETLPEERVRVAVSKGRVLVNWPSGHAELKAGADGLFSSAQPGEDESLVDRRVALTEKSRIHNENSDWRAAARKGENRIAMELILSHSDSVRNEPGDLLLAADVMRLNREPRRAVTYLKRVVGQFPGDSRRATAAFTLGKVYLDELGMAAEAARAFGIAAGNRSPLSEEAQAREAEAWYRASRLDKAREAAARYLRQYSNGARSDKVRSLYNELQ